MLKELQWVKKVNRNCIKRCNKPAMCREFLKREELRVHKKEREREREVEHLKSIAKEMQSTSRGNR